MKSNLNRTAFLLFGIFCFCNLHAQTKDTTKKFVVENIKPFQSDTAFRTWSIAVNAGVLSFSNILETNNRLDFTSTISKFGYGLYVKKQLLPSFGIETQFFAGSLSSANSQETVNGIPKYTRFDTKINYALSLNTVYNIGNINWHYNNFGIQPFLSVGFGIIDYETVLTNTDGSKIRVAYNNNAVVNECFVPIEFGIKFNVSENVNLELGYQLNFVYADNVDGYNYGTSNDKFTYGHIGLEFALGKHSKPQLATFNPVSSMRYEYLKQKKDVETKPGQQLMKLTNIKEDKLQHKVDSLNQLINKLTIDSDSDGVSDFFDKCPNTPKGTKVDGAGCPIEKVESKADISEKENQVVFDAITNLQFEAGKTDILAGSLPTLNKLAQLLIDKKLNLKLSGYADIQGSDEINLKLSKNRAEAVKTYLVSKGVKPASITTIGYGKTYPIAPNKTDAGRQLNRRVEFSLY